MQTVSPLKCFAQGARYSEFVDIFKIQSTFFPFTRNYDDHAICEMLSENLDDYIKEAVQPVHQAKFEAMMKKLNVKINPVAIRPPEISTEMLQSNKCEGVCKNDLLLDEVDQFFNSMKKKPTLPPQSTSRAIANVTFPKPTNYATNDSVKISVDDIVDLEFETNFRRKRDANRGIKNVIQRGPSSSSGFGNSRVTENRFPTVDLNSNPASVPTDNQKPFERNKFDPFSALKRKPDESGTNLFKKPAYLPKPQPENDDRTPFVPKCDFKSATEELTIQVIERLFSMMVIID